MNGSQRHRGLHKDAEAFNNIQRDSPNNIFGLYDIFSSEVMDSSLKFCFGKSNSQGNEPLHM